MEQENEYLDLTNTQSDDLEFAPKFDGAIEAADDEFMPSINFTI